MGVGAASSARGMALAQATTADSSFAWREKTRDVENQAWRTAVRQVVQELKRPQPERAVVPTLPPYQAVVFAGCGPEVTSFDDVLDPVNRDSEIVFGTLMTMCYVGSLEVIGVQSPFFMAELALLCNLAWGLVDGSMYVFRLWIERGREMAVLRRLAESDSKPPSELRDAVGELLPLEVLALTDDQVRFAAKALVRTRDRAGTVVVTLRDVFAGFTIACIVFLTTFPLVMPFFFVSDIHSAVRWCHGIAVGILAVVGLHWSVYSGLPRMCVTLSFVAVGIGLTFIVMRFNGGAAGPCTSWSGTPSPTPPKSP